MSAEQSRDVEDLPTPCFLVDIDRVRANVDRMLTKAKAHGIQLRPHMKTHKTVEAGILMTGGTKKCCEVSTLAEAEFFADNGFDDILYAYPITSNKVQRCRELFNRLTAFHLMTDSQHGIDCLKQEPPRSGSKWSVYLEVDLGHCRTGVTDENEIISMAKKLSSAEHIQFRGLYVHTGQSYEVKGAEEIKKANTDCVQKLLAMKRSLNSS